MSYTESLSNALSPVRYELKNLSHLSWWKSDGKGNFIVGKFAPKQVNGQYVWHRLGSYKQYDNKEEVKENNPNAVPYEHELAPIEKAVLTPHQLGLFGLAGGKDYDFRSSDIDYRPTESIPEDFYAMHRSEQSMKYSQRWSKEKVLSNYAGRIFRDVMTVLSDLGHSGLGRTIPVNPSLKADWMKQKEVKPHLDDDGKLHPLFAALVEDAAKHLADNPDATKDSNWVHKFVGSHFTDLPKTDSDESFRQGVDYLDKTGRLNPIPASDVDWRSMETIPEDHYAYSLNSVLRYGVKVPEFKPADPEKQYLTTEHPLDDGKGGRYQPDPIYTNTKGKLNKTGRLLEDMSLNHNDEGVRALAGKALHWSSGDANYLSHIVGHSKYDDKPVLTALHHRLSETDPEFANKVNFTGLHSHLNELGNSSDRFISGRQHKKVDEIALKEPEMDAGEVDWRSTEVIPEDFYAFRRREQSIRYGAKDDVSQLDKAIGSLIEQAVGSGWETND